MDKTYTYQPDAKYPFQYKYEHMAVTTDCVIFCYEDWKLKVLLVRRGGEPYKGMWAFPGGFLRMKETAEEGALRELREETGLSPASIGQLGVFSAVNRDPRERVITIAWYALVKPSEVVGGDDAAEAAWFPVDELPPVGFDLLDDTFTIPDLQRLYEAILGVKFDRRNFQRKILSSGILDETPGETMDGIYEEMEDAFPAPKMLEDDCLMSMNTASSPVENSRKKSRPGRKGAWFSFNRKRYDELKEDGLKQEF